MAPQKKIEVTKKKKQVVDVVVKRFSNKLLYTNKPFFNKEANVVSVHPGSLQHLFHCAVCGLYLPTSMIQKHFAVQSRNSKISCHHYPKYLEYCERRKEREERGGVGSDDDSKSIISHLSTESSEGSDDDHDGVKNSTEQEVSD